MSIDNHVPDGTFVEAVADLATPEHKLLDIGRGQKLLVGYDAPEVYGEQLEDEPKSIGVSTLTGIVDAYNAKISKDVDVIIHVLEPDNVEIIAPVVGNRKQRFKYVGATPHLPEIHSGRYMELDLFILQLQTNFLPSTERDRALKYVGSLTSGLASDIVDDGVSQSVTTKRGITRTGTEQFLNPVILRPFRTFPEIEQPESPFVLRTKQISDGENLSAAAALYEADGGAWRTTAVQRIGEYLREKLPDAVILA